MPAQGSLLLQPRQSRPHCHHLPLGSPTGQQLLEPGLQGQHKPKGSTSLTWPWDLPGQEDTREGALGAAQLLASAPLGLGAVALQNHPNVSNNQKKSLPGLWMPFEELRQGGSRAVAPEPRRLSWAGCSVCDTILRSSSLLLQLTGFFPKLETKPYGFRKAQKSSGAAR